jgi:Fe-S cluster biosynthesis and repair protein YggX
MPITCSLCGGQQEALPRSPLPGPLGVEVQARVCPECWQEWLRTQVMLINEHRLNLLDPAVRQALAVQMRTFLKLELAKPA